MVRRRLAGLGCVGLCSRERSGRLFFGGLLRSSPLALLGVSAVGMSHTNHLWCHGRRLGLGNAAALVVDPKTAVEAFVDINQTAGIASSCWSRLDLDYRAEEGHRGADSYPP